jgi:hypothetical protein
MQLLGHVGVDALHDGVEPTPAIVERIYADVPEKLHMAAAMSVESHLKKLAKEGRVSEAVESNAPSRWRLVG